MEESAIDLEENSHSSSDEDEPEEDEKQKVDVKIGKTRLPRVLKSLRPKKNKGKVLQIHMDPDHTYTFDALRDFLFRVVDALPLVKKVEIATEHFVGSMGRLARWPIRLLTELLEKWIEQKREILWIRLCFLQVEGTWEEFYGLAQTLKGIKSLEKFNLDKISLVEKPGGHLPTHPGCWLDPIVQSLAKLPRLFHLRILGTRDFGPPPGDEQMVVLQDATLRLLCESTSLRSVCLIHFNLNDGNIYQMAKSLMTNETLQELDIDCTLEKRSCYALTDLMECKTALEDLNLCVRCKTDESEEERITNLNGGNVDQATGLNEQQKEALACEDEINERLARGVGASTLVNFALFRGRISAKSQDAFRHMISKQHHLESLTLYTGDETLNKALAEDPIIAFYVKMNYFGRRQFLLDQPPSGRWKSAKSAEKANKMRYSGKRQSQKRKTKSSPPSSSVLASDRSLVDTLARVNDDLSCLYYFLNAKPSICDRALQKMNREEPDWQKPKRSAPVASDGAPPSKRTRLYRAVKYRRVCYT